MRSGLIVVLFLLVGSTSLLGQKQLVLLKRQKVIARFSNGDDFIYKLKKSKVFTKGFIVDIKEFSVITFKDTIPFAAIDRVSLRGHARKGYPLISQFCIDAGLAYFIIDEFNNIVVQGNKADFDPIVWQPALILVGAGFIIKWAHKGSERIRYPVKLVMVQQ